MFYNLVGDTNVAKPNHFNERLFQQAKRSNPDPGRFVPVQATGFTDLKNRINEQTKAHAAFQNKLKKTKETLEEMNLQHEQAKSLVTKLRKEHTQLASRLLRVMSNIEQKGARSQPPKIEEVNYRKRLRHINRKLNQPHVFLSKVNDMTNTVARVYNDRSETQPFPDLLFTPEAKKHIFQFLATQKQSLAYLTQVVQKDQRDMASVNQVLQATSSTAPSKLALMP